MQNAVPYRVFSTGALLLFLATVVHLLHARLGMAEFYHFVLPAAVAGGADPAGRTERAADGTGDRFNSLLRLVIPFVGGVLSPVIIFLRRMRGRERSANFFRVSRQAQSRARLGWSASSCRIEKSIFALALVGLVAAAMYRREFQGRAVGAAVGVGLMLILVKSAASSEIVLGVWYSAATLTPLVVLLGAAVVLRRENGVPSEQTPAAADHGTDLTGRDLQPGAVSVRARRFIFVTRCR